MKGGNARMSRPFPPEIGALLPLAKEYGWDQGTAPNGGILLRNQWHPGVLVSIPPHQHWPARKVDELRERIVTEGDPAKSRPRERIETPGPAQPKPGRAPLPAPPSSHLNYTEKPWVVHAGTNSAYESPIMVMRTYSDGRISYICRHPGCGFERPKRTSMIPHWAKNPSHPTIRPDRHPTHSDHPEPRNFNEHLEELQPNAPVIRSQEGDEALVTLEQIRALVLPGWAQRWDQREQEWRTRVAELESQLHATQNELTEVKVQLRTSESDHQALRDLVNGRKPIEITEAS